MRITTPPLKAMSLRIFSNVHLRASKLAVARRMSLTSWIQEAMIEKCQREEKELQP
jgi:predicted HicB family RNase H-like nuclease